MAHKNGSKSTDKALKLASSNVELTEAIIPLSKVAASEFYSVIDKGNFKASKRILKVISNCMGPKPIIKKQRFIGPNNNRKEVSGLTPWN